jgi:hypothetical protein
MNLVPVKKRSLTPAQFERLADVPPEEEWLANITNAKTRRAYKNDVREFVAYAGLSGIWPPKTVHSKHAASGPAGSRNHLCRFGVHLTDSG